MLYIHQTSCISPQQTFNDVDIEHLNGSVNNQMNVKEPVLKNIPPGILRRMSKNVKIGLGTALPLLEQTKVDGIIIGTANGGMEESIKFLNQIVEYDEGLLTPGDFVQSTANAVASQISLMTTNKSYNATHVHRGFSFENALLDGAMLIKENPQRNILVGGMDVISHYNYNIDTLAGCYKDKQISNADLYNTNTKGTMAGEGAAMFIVNGLAENAISKIEAVEMCSTKEVSVIKKQLGLFIKEFIKEGEYYLLLSGEDGDIRSLEYYTACESLLADNVTVARYKHLTGDYATVSAVAVWLACYILKHQHLPAHMAKRAEIRPGLKKIIICNSYRESQHSFILIEKM